jgi:small subunit ribosomal protein S9
MAKNKKKIIETGKRKTSVARAVIEEGDGKIRINKKPYKFLPELRKLMIDEPLKIAKEVLGGMNYDIDVNVSGGGQESQIEASRLAIAKALVKASKSKKLEDAYLDYDRNLLVADTRRKEAYKPGVSKARKKRQKSYR